MKTLTIEVLINGQKYYPRLTIDDAGKYRGRGLPENAIDTNEARDALNWWCKGFGDAVNEWVAQDGNDWYRLGVAAGERWRNEP